MRRNRGRVGAAAGPAALRPVLANFAWHQQCPVYDAGDITFPEGDLEAAQDRLAAVVAAILAAGHWPLVIGGGHETAWGTHQGLLVARPRETIGVINLDAHLDLRATSPGTSGTPFAQMAARYRTEGRPFHYLCLGVSQAANTQALFERAAELKARVWFDRDMTSRLLDVREEIARFVSLLDSIHLSIDLDVLPASVMPAVSAPATRGVTLDIIETLIGTVLSSGRVRVVDLVEYNPMFDEGGRGARVAARLAWQIALEWKEGITARGS